MIALAGVELETLVSAPDALTTRDLSGPISADEVYVARFHSYI